MLQAPGKSRRGRDDRDVDGPPPQTMQAVAMACKRRAEMGLGCILFYGMRILTIIMAAAHGKW